MAIKKLIFGFRETTVRDLKNLKEETAQPSLAQTVMNAIYLHKALADQIKKGYTQVILENPTNGKQKILFSPVFAYLVNKYNINAINKLSFDYLKKYFGSLLTKYINFLRSYN